MIFAVDIESLEKCCKEKPVQHSAFALRSEVRDYENGIEDDIYDYVTAAEYRVMDRELKKAYLYENLCTTDDTYNLQLQFFSIVESEMEQHKKIAIKMRSTFAETTGITDKNSAISVLIDAPQYIKVEEFARPYGTNVDQILKWFFDFIVEPKNYEKMDELLGF